MAGRATTLCKLKGKKSPRPGQGQLINTKRNPNPKLRSSIHL